MDAFAVSAFYRFADLPHFADLRQPLLAFCQSQSVRGIILLAAEGINATIACESGNIDVVMRGIGEITGLGPLTAKRSGAATMPFRRLKVRLKKEIVTIGDATVDPLRQVGTYVKPKDWNALISDPDVLVIDTRNSFEHSFGTFRGAIDPRTTSFGEFPDFVKSELSPQKHRRIAMFCTGGIRCEKATSLLLREGFHDVYHLEGGILQYLEDVPKEESLWEGSCFVFDQRVSLAHGLEIAPVKLCLNCDAALDADAVQSPDFEDGVCCGNCAALQTPAQKTSARERQRQIVASLRRPAPAA